MSAITTRTVDVKLFLQNESNQHDWLHCISNRTGLPKLLLTFALLLSCIGMIWLCMTTTVTAREQRVSSKQVVQL